VTIGDVDNAQAIATEQHAFGFEEAMIIRTAMAKDRRHAMESRLFQSADPRTINNAKDSTQNPYPLRCGPLFGDVPIIVENGGAALLALSR
jgi:hypothetical protein